jgi:hypothetical protein
VPGQRPSAAFQAVCFVTDLAKKQFSIQRNLFPLLTQNSRNCEGLQLHPTTRRTVASNRMEITMRALSLSLILASTLILSGVSVAGSAGNGVPHAGLFQINPSQPVVMASR